MMGTTPAAVRITANGKPRALPQRSTVLDLLNDRGLAPLQVVVEYNGEPLPRERFADTVLSEGDRLEIAQMVGGG